MDKLKRVLVRALSVFFLVASSCTTAEIAEEPPLYEEYDRRVNELREAVEKGALTVTEAEQLRQEAFQDYMENLKKKRTGMEYRNY